MVAPAEMTSGSWASLPIVPVTPPSPVDSVISHAGGDGLVVEQLDRVAGAVVREVAEAERLVDDVDVVDAHGVVDGLQDRAVGQELAAGLDRDDAGARRDAEDADVAARRQRVVRFTKFDRSWVTVPCAAIADASPKASPPPVGAFGPSPEKSW